MLNFESVKDIMNSLNNMKIQVDSIERNYSKLIKLGSTICKKEETQENKEKQYYTRKLPQDVKR